MLVNGKKVVLIGDEINCPVEGHGINTIIEVAPEWISDGKYIVVDGCECKCGCHVISSAPDSSVG
jgi:uncharacterized Zn-binding protein involved in type VI secretion